VERATRCPEDTCAEDLVRDAPRFSALRFNWYLGVGRAFDVVRVRDEAPALLAALEESGLELVDLKPGAGTLEDPALTALRLLGVRSIHHVGAAEGAGGTLDIAIRLPSSRNENPTLALGRRPS